MFDFTFRWLNLNCFLLIPVFSLIPQNFNINLMNVAYMSSYINKAFLKKPVHNKLFDSNEYIKH